MTGFADLLDEIDRIETVAEPTPKDLARLEVLADDTDPLVAMMARSARNLARMRARRSEGNTITAPPSASTTPQAAPESGEEIREGKKAGGPTPEKLPDGFEQPITSSTTLVVDDVTGVAEAMATRKFVSYLRVSTAKQGASGLGLDAQRKAVADFLAGGSVIREFVEVESGKRSDRPKLAEALALCRIHGATLVIAKLDRLSRDAHFLLGLEKAGVDFIAADMPTANRLTVGIMAMVADEERRMISARTRAALAAKARWYAGLTEAERDELRAQGKPVQLGGDKGRLAEVRARGTAAGVAVRQERAAARASDIRPIITGLQADGVTSLAQLAAALTERGIPTSRGADRWSPMQVSRILKAASHGT